MLTVIWSPCIFCPSRSKVFVSQVRKQRLVFNLIWVLLVPSVPVAHECVDFSLEPRSRRIRLLTWSLFWWQRLLLTCASYSVTERVLKGLEESKTVACEKLNEEFMSREWSFAEKCRCLRIMAKNICEGSKGASGICSSIRIWTKISRIFSQYLLVLSLPITTSPCTSTF